MAFVVTPLKAFTAEPQGQKNKKLYLYQVDPMLLEEEEGFNLRYYDDPKVVAHIEAFCESYMADRYVPPMMVRALADGRIVVIEGHCRRRGVQLAIARGANIPLVSVIPFRGNDAERVELMLRSAQGLKLEPLDIARGYLRLQQIGLKPAEIAASQSKTQARVEQLLTLATAGSEVHDLVRTGSVSVDIAIEAIRTHGEQAATLLSHKLEAAKQEGRQRVTKSVVRSQTVPRKTVEAVFARVERAMEKMSAALRRQAEELQAIPERDRANQTIEVDANVLIGLLQAAQEIEAMKAQQAKKAARREEAEASPGT
jgi:ParB family transcriptional regulator, chromosome partitioning protein